MPFVMLAALAADPALPLAAAYASPSAAVEAALRCGRSGARPACCGGACARARHTRGAVREGSPCAA
jgi:hypothetical protein